ncbi:MAG: aconitate hydratase AcnA [Bdellovibrionales bacterium]|nr:aconitate hydratase AcnA [Bdellovibrionales bacterium]
MNSFGTLSTITIGGKTLHYHSLPLLEKKLGIDLSRMPYGLKILLENLLRFEDGEIVKKADIEALLNQDPKKESDHEIQFTPGRVLLQDFTGVPVVADLASMRAAMIARKGNADKVNPLQPVDLVIDHSVQVDYFAENDALDKNLKLEFERNGERYEFLKWGQKSLRNFQVVPPGTGICHQVNIEYLAHVAMLGELRGQTFVYPDTVVGTDSHTPMVNALGVVGWGVGGIEAEAAMLGQPCTMLIPQVVGFEMTGRLPVGATATDLVLTVTQMLRKKGVVGKFVEYFGEGVSTLTVADRATISNMAPEYGATIGIFPPDAKTIEYLKTTGRTERAERAEKYYREQGLFVDGPRKNVNFSDVLTLDLSTVEPSMAGPSKPHDRVTLKTVRNSFRKFAVTRYPEEVKKIPSEQIQAWLDDGGALKCKTMETDSCHPDAHLGPLGHTVAVSDPKGHKYNLAQGSIVIAAITSCTNTSNPDLMVGAALLARNAVAKGLKPKPWVKTSFAPGSKVVTDYLTAAGLWKGLDAIGFNLVGYGCTTCIGNSGPLPPHIQAAIDKGGLATAAVLSGNRNFEARIHPSVLGNYLASPPLVVAYALAGNINMNLTVDPLGYNDKGEAVYLKDVWPDREEISAIVMRHVTSSQFGKAYSTVDTGDENWQKTKASGGATYVWSDASTYIKQPPFFDQRLIEEAKAKEIKGARILGWFGDFITTDHISPAGNIGKSTPAGQYLVKHGVQPADFNSYGARRGNHEVMIRGTFANVRIKNKMVGKEGGFTLGPDGKETTIFDASETYAKSNTPLVIFAGKEYGSGSSRDWAAKGTRLLGVRAVVAESYERIHRSNLVGMGVLPLQFADGTKAENLGLKGDEIIEISGLDSIQPKSDVEVVIRSGGETRKIKAKVRIDTPNELKYFRSGGILPFVLDRLAK